MINNDSIDALEQAAPFSAAASPQPMAVPDGWKLVPVQPTPEIIAGAAIASWPTATLADIDLARQAAPLVLMQMDMAAGTTVDALAGMLATMAPAYRAMLAAAPKYSPLPATAPQVVADERAALDEIADLFSIGAEARKDLGTIITNVRNTVKFSNLLHAVEREFFMSPDDENECQLNCWGSTTEQYLAAMRAAIAAKAAS